MAIHSRLPIEYYVTYVNIPLTQGLYTKIDVEDYARVGHILWNARNNNGAFYATNWNEGKLHRVLLNAPPHLCVDHINGDTLDNRKSNLRLCTKAENRQNSTIPKGRKYKGVYSRPNGKWRAFIRIDGKGTSLGEYWNEEDAARAYDVAALEAWGEFARLNFGENPLA